MFQIVDVYLIFKHSHQKPKRFRIEINIDLEATIVEVKICVYMAQFYPIWIEHSGVMLNYDPLLPPKESKTDGIMMGWGKSRLKLVQQFLEPDNMKIDIIHCLNDSEPC